MLQLQQGNESQEGGSFIRPLRTGGKFDRGQFSLRLGIGQGNFIKTNLT